MRPKGEKGYTKKPSKKEVKKKKILECSVGQKCPACNKEGSISRREYGDHIFFRRGIISIPGFEPGAFLPLECSSCHVRFAEKEEKKVLACRVGQNCPACKSVGSIAKRDKGNRISLGDGMVPLVHLRADAFLPLECTSCNTRYQKARESLFSRLRNRLKNTLLV